MLHGKINPFKWNNCRVLSESFGIEWVFGGIKVIWNMWRRKWFKTFCRLNFSCFFIFVFKNSKLPHTFYHFFFVCSIFTTCTVKSIKEKKNHKKRFKFVNWLNTSSCYFHPTNTHTHTQHSTGIPPLIHRSSTFISMIEWERFEDIKFDTTSKKK